VTSAAHSEDSRASSGEPARYLIVGYPGLVARAALRALMQDSPEAVIDVLVDSPEHAAHVRETAHARRLTLRPWLGQLDAIDLGLAGPAYTELASRTERILWCVEPSLRAGDTLERSPALRGAAELVELCRHSENLEGAVYLSTIFALGSATGAISESELRVGQKFAHRFEEAAAVAERIVERAQRDLPLCIARAVPALGDAETGECPAGGALVQLVHALQASPAVVTASFSGDPVHVASADWLARALLRLAKTPSARGRRVHLVDPEPVTDARFFEVVAHACERRVDERPLAGLRGRPQSPLSKLDVPEAKALRGWAVRWDTTEGRALLPDLPVPKLEDYVPILVEWCRSKDDGAST
jgi:nucleoside-diphosphate-sugar epimerase